jgi:hypothetical protein
MTYTYSSISKFEQCPFVYKLQYIDRCLPYVQSDAAKYGSEHHDFLDKAISGKQDFTPRYEFLKPIVEAVQRIPGEKKTEYAIAFHKDWTPTDWFDKTSFIKGKADLTIFHPTEPRILLKDWKFSGKAGESEAQKYRLELDMFCLLHFKKHDVERIDTELVWLKTRSPGSKKTYTRDMLPELEDKILGKIERIEEAVATDEFPCRVGGLCVGWCSAGTLCKHWKPFKDKK